MEINSLNKLDQLEFQIRQQISQFKLGDVLYSLYNIQHQLHLFISAKVALFAIRFSSPSLVTQGVKLVKIDKIINLVTAYSLADPITFDQQLKDDFIEANPVFLILRIVSSQFPINVSRFSQFANPIFLYYDIPKKLKGQKGIPNFDIEKEFENINGVSVAEFINLGFVLSAFASNQFTFSFDFLKKTRSKGINLPNDEAIFKAINELAGDKYKINNLYDERKNSDRRFRMYDFNPLRIYPLIFPCKGSGFSKNKNEFMCAPVPALIDERVSIGIFHQMFGIFREKFSNYFGYVLEEYLRIILENCVNSKSIIDIRNLSLGNNIKTPDYAIIDGSVAIILECKATRFTLPAQNIASEQAVNESLKQVKKGLLQLDNFIKACQSKLQNLEQFHNCSTFKPVLVTLEEMYLINSGFFKDHVNDLLKNDGILNLNWQILSIGEIERLQPHLLEGIYLSQVLQDLEQKTFNDVLEDLTAKTQKTYKDSFLYPKQEELYQRLGIPD
jgi:hypothetical protein